MRETRPLFSVSKKKAVQCSTGVRTVSSKTLKKTDSRRTGWAVMSTSLPPQLNYMLCLLLVLYTFVKCCFNWHLEKKLSRYLAACFCFMSIELIFFPSVPRPSFRFFVPLPHEVSLLFYVFLFLLHLYIFSSSLCLPSFRTTASHSPMIVFLHVLPLLSSYLHILVFCPSTCVSPFVCSFLSSNL